MSRLNSRRFNVGLDNQTNRAGVSERRPGKCILYFETLKRKGEGGGRARYVYQQNCTKSEASGLTVDVEPRLLNFGGVEKGCVAHPE